MDCSELMLQARNSGFADHEHGVGVSVNSGRLILIS